MAATGIFRRTAVALLGASALLGSLNAVQAQNGGGGGGGGGGPNVVVIMSDDQGQSHHLVTNLVASNMSQTCI